MSTHHRKLLAELDNQLKKAWEKCEEFDEMYKRVLATTNPTIKARQEEEFKKQMKILVRVREKIRSYMGNSEYKEREDNLEELRRKIEDYMELFKSWEKEIKTKAFSKEGLSLAKMDKKVEEKEKTKLWLNDCLKKLNSLHESLEAEMEAKANSKKKTKRSKTTLDPEIKIKLDGLKEGIKRVEIMLRSLENESISPDQLNDVRDTLECLIDNPNDKYNKSLWDTKYESIEEDLLPDNVVLPDLSSNLNDQEEDKELSTQDLSGQATPPSQPVAEQDMVKNASKTPNFNVVPKEEKGAVPVVASKTELATKDVHPPPGLLTPTSKDAQGKQEGIQRQSPEAKHILTHPERLAFSPSIMRTPSPSKFDRAKNCTPLDLLEASARNMVRPQDSMVIAPANPVPVSKQKIKFPTLPMQVTPELLSKFDDDTLFFIFYYQQGSYEQYLASNVLKARQWSFHTKYMTWFQRANTGKEEAGSETSAYIYFDHESGWCHRIKNDFVFDPQFQEKEAISETF